MPLSNRKLALAHIEQVSAHSWVVSFQDMLHFTYCVRFQTLIYNIVHSIHNKLKLEYIFEKSSEKDKGGLFIKFYWG